MQNTIAKLVSTICEPSPHPTRNPIDHNLLFKRNKTSFKILSITFIGQFMPSLAGLPWSVNSLFISWRIFTLVSFLLLCRSYTFWFNLVFTIAASLGPALLLYLEKDIVFPCFAFCTVIPVFVLLITNNTFLMLFTGLAQVITYFTIFQKLLREALFIMDVETILRRLVISNIAGIVIIMLVFGFVIKEMNKTARELANANKAAEAALEQQKTFVFSFSHELRNPLNSLLGNLQLVLMNNISPQTREMVKTSQICAELLLQLVNNILDVGKCDIGKLEVSLVPTKVYDLFERIWAISSNLVSRKQLRNYIKIEERVPSVLMLDSHRVNQMMMNLLGNAIKFTDDGSITVTVEWLDSSLIQETSFEPYPYNEDETSEGISDKDENLLMLRTVKSSSSRHLDNYYLLTKEASKFKIRDDTRPTETKEGVLKIIVRDTGCGMDQAALSKLFQRFSQVSTDVHKRQLGTGLGLYITKEVARKMNGDIRVYSKPGVGTTFILLIPTMSVVHYNQMSPSGLGSSMLEELKQKKLSVLIADDSPFNITMVCNYFNKVGAYVADTADDGLEAYNKYKKSIEAGTVIDVVTLDIDMPKMDGKTACKKIREYEVQKGISPATIILISGNYDDQQLRESLSSNDERKADHFLRKPLSFEDFLLAVYRLRVRE